MNSRFINYLILPVYKISVALFEYNEEDFETGVDAIDITRTEELLSSAVDLTVVGGNHFVQGEIVTQVITADPAVSVYGEIQTVTKTSDVRSNSNVYPTLELLVLLRLKTS